MEVYTFISQARDDHLIVANIAQPKRGSRSAPAIVARWSNPTHTHSAFGKIKITRHEFSECGHGVRMLDGDQVLRLEF